MDPVANFACPANAVDDPETKPEVCTANMPESSLGEF